MCRMLGVICNDEDLLPCAIQDVKDALKCEDGQVHDGIGVGYYNQDDPLLSKKPSAKSEEIDYTELVEGITSRVLLVHIRKATVGAWKEDNTHPFRFRRWLFAHVGHFPALEEKREEVIGRLPPFLARNLSGDTDSELAFHLFLEILFREGKLNDLNLDVEDLDAYLKECVENIEKLHEGPHRPKMAIMITNGQVMAAACRGITMHYSHREGILECPLHEDSEQQQHLHGRFRGIMLGAAMSNPGHQWREVADGSRLHISRNLELKVQQL
jgi:predicted glutamine amidotransferase